MKTLEQIEEEWVLTLVQGVEHSQDVYLYWFGRLDRKDNLVPTKIEATNARTAWGLLLEQLNAQSNLPEQV